MRVVVFYNHIGHFKTPPGFGSWLEYWQARTGRKPKDCKNIDCTSMSSYDDLVGAHIDIPGRTGVYLIPLCKTCNNYNNQTLMHGYDFDIVLVPNELLIPEY